VDTTCNASTQWRAPANTVALDDLAMVKPDEGWAVGALTSRWPPVSPGQGPAGVIYHLTQGRWQRLPQVYPGAALSTISMGSPADGWAASSTAVTGTGNHVLVLHYSGGHWRTVDIPVLDAVLKGSPASSGGTLDGINVQMFGSDAGWLFATTNLPRDAKNPLSGREVIILRYEHGAWTPIPPPSEPATTTLFTLSAISADEAWIVGTEYGSDLTTRFAHYSHGVWSPWPQTFPGATDRLGMLSPANGWAFDSGGGPTLLLHYDGIRWAPVATPDWADQRIALAALVFPVASGSLWFTATQQGASVTGKALIEQYAGGQWRQVTWPFADVLPERIVAVSSNELWGIGDIGHQEGCAPAAVFVLWQGVFLHSQQGRWSQDILCVSFLPGGGAGCWQASLQLMPRHLLARPGEGERRCCRGRGKPYGGRG
jgi:hypothetical protein